MGFARAAAPSAKMLSCAELEHVPSTAAALWVEAGGYNASCSISLEGASKISSIHSDILLIYLIIFLMDSRGRFELWEHLTSDGLMAEARLDLHRLSLVLRFLLLASCAVREEDLQALSRRP